MLGSAFCGSYTHVSACHDEVHLHLTSEYNCVVYTKKKLNRSFLERTPTRALEICCYLGPFEDATDSDHREDTTMRNLLCLGKESARFKLIWCGRGSRVHEDENLLYLRVLGAINMVLVLTCWVVFVMYEHRDLLVHSACLKYEQRFLSCSSDIFVVHADMGSSRIPLSWSLRLILLYLNDLHSLHVCEWWDGWLLLRSSISSKLPHLQKKHRIHLLYRRNTICRTRHLNIHVSAQ